jgi:hypothetical protein
VSIAPITLVQATDAPNAAAAQYTCPANSKVVVRHAVFVNHTAGAVTLSVYVVESGGSVTDARKVLDVLSIAAHTAYVSPELAGVVLNAGDAIQTVASASASISQNISGILQTN